MNLFLLGELVIVLAASVLVIFLSHKAKIPAVVGFLLTGVLIGPGGLSLVRDAGTINVLAEVGVVMLLFMIGLEFTPARLKWIQRSFWLGGSLQVSLTILAAVFVLSTLGVAVRTAVFYGFLVSLSSTAVVMKIFADRTETDAPQGRISLGILIFQDLAVVVMIGLVPALAVTHGASFAALGLRFLLSCAVIAAAFLVARLLMPRILHVVVQTRIREVFLITSLFICLGMAWLTYVLGLSLALGAFLAGAVIAESRYSHQVVSDILPFRDAFNSLFFISIGMLLNTSAVWNEKFVVLALVVSIIILKAAVVAVAVLLLGYSSRIATITGLALAQVGEFSFVLAGVGRENGLLAGESFQVFLAASILTIAAAPFLIQLSPAVAARSGPGFRWRRIPIPPETPGHPPHPIRALKDHVIIAGHGLSGRNLAHVLKEAGIPYAVLDLNPQTFRMALSAEEPIIFGDASSRTILKEAGVDRARGFVLAISDPPTTRRAVRAAKDLNRNIFVIVRTRFAAEVDELYALGADEVIPEEFETSLEIFTRVLERYHIPPNIVDAQIRILRGECYGILRGTCEFSPRPAERIADLLNAGTADTFYIVRGTWPAGKTLGEIDLRSKTGAAVIAVARGEEAFPSPGADFRIEAGDTLVLVASHESMNRAFGFLSRTEP